ncbi:MAG: RnfABCDGE type electron transport complex subunit D [Sterolibacteriaceae bacterium]|uniref:Ion-translocating oxidoreductase complex subunit D n=1 Tax=Candidatus Methylophosphatis roskildensis TaxID=2899263 RepID=A0A9D7E4X5_9PROT|nr:RnfABCDGE type electron transport complex subunit D [Candidatus Methylophosphatis roskildensis]MBK7236947.1 RnfABCDGE type electron transport complex subunit D [Sterolibacteriaceae bacterium]
MNNSPYIRQPASVQTVMLKVLLALLPGIGAYVWLFGAGVLVNLAIASAAALAGEALMLKARGRPLDIYLADLSAVVTAWLIVLTFPPIVPWWLTVAATLFAIVIVKQLYGGLGQNPFNPAMAAYAIMIVAFPALISQWPHSGLDFATQLDLIRGGSRNIDAITGATPLDALRTGLRQAVTPMTVQQVIAGGPAFGVLGGKGWEWIAGCYLLGGLWLWQQRVITWHLPLAFLAGIAVFAGALWGIDPGAFASPLFHLVSGGTLLGAFFIVTDPVSGATTPRGKLIFAVGVALITVIIRTFGAYPDGIAFAVLLMNICVPLIDMKTQPPVFGHKDD